MFATIGWPVSSTRIAKALIEETELLPRAQKAIAKAV
jgi:hypothetical protein